MATIIYGVSGEGSGHSSRAREMITHLESRGHEVHAVSYDRGYANLKDDFQVLEIVGLHITTEDNRVRPLKTVLDNLAKVPEGSRRLKGLKDLFQRVKPDCVISDFEPMTAYLAYSRDLPLITLDNQHRMRYMKYPCPRNLRKDALVTEAVIRGMVPRPDVSLVTTFYFGEVTNDRTFLFPPIIRREVLDLEPRDGDYLLVYVTQDFRSLVRRLADFPRERFRVYGAEGTSTANVEFKPFSREGFLDDLAGCKGVIATAGFTLLTESLHLRKPFLALPMKGQFEQELNGLLLAETGYGKNCRRVSGEALGDFLYRLPEFRKRLSEYESTDNERITSFLDRLLADDCAEARTYFQARRS